MSESSDPILTAIARLRQFTQVEIQTQWHYCQQELAIATALDSQQWQHWSIAPLKDRGHIAWQKGSRPLWLAQSIRVPKRLNGYAIEGLALRLALTWWAEDARIFIDGRLARQGDLFDFADRLLVSPSVRAGDTIDVAIRLQSPGHDDGALVASRCIYETPDPSIERRNGMPLFEPGFVADELAVLRHYLNRFDPDRLSDLADAVAEIEWEALPHQLDRFERSLTTLRQKLCTDTTGAIAKPVEQLHAKSFLKKRRIHLLGHAHLDMAWLWPVSETWEVAQRTFESVLKLQSDFPDFIFSHSTPALYEWIEINRPDLFGAIQQQVAAGRWEVGAGLWVEPEFNLVSGEAIARQILYGQRYVREKFGAVSKVAWLPDSFGFCAQLPQLLQLGQIDYFVTQKLRWNDTTEFPYELFWWESPDGSRILSWMSPHIGQDIDPVKMADYACEWEAKTGERESFWLPGVGDRGGGPTRNMLQAGDRWQSSPLFPQLQFSRATDYLDELARRSRDLPIWRDELYLEFHRGCYTSHADQKYWNRHCERSLYRAELFASLATLIADAPYAKTQLESAWKQVLFNQFHDILPGSAIPAAYGETDGAWEDAARAAQEVLDEALGAIATRIECPSPPHPQAQPWLVWNEGNGARSGAIAIHVPNPQTYRACDRDGQPVPTQVGENSTLRLHANDVPGVGYALVWLIPESPESPEATGLAEKEVYRQPHFTQSSTKVAEKIAPVNKRHFSGQEFQLENSYLRAIVDPETGNLSSLVHKPSQREILNKIGGNRLQCFRDDGQYWDAWNIDPNYQQHLLPAPTLHRIEWIERGEVRQRVRVVRRWGNSQFCQDYILDFDSPVLEIANTVDWQERHVLVKAAFGAHNLDADFATYETACGAIARPTRPQTRRDRAKWEVPALGWADLTDRSGDFGVSILADCKHGYDATPSQLRLSLLRGSEWPDPKADLGRHEFRYGIYPHAGDWKQAQTPWWGWNFDRPLFARAIAGSPSGSLPPIATLLEISNRAIVPMALKQSEDDPNVWIFRGYEGYGETATISLGGKANLTAGDTVDLLETPTVFGQGQLRILPWQIVSLGCRVG